jgi:hypothetical protein
MHISPMPHVSLKTHDCIDSYRKQPALTRIVRFD